MLLSNSLLTLQACLDSIPLGGLSIFALGEDEMLSTLKPIAMVLPLSTEPIGLA